MLEIKDYEVMGFRMAIKGMRNALSSWSKSDSGYGCAQYDVHCEKTEAKSIGG